MTGSAAAPPAGDTSVPTEPAPAGTGSARRCPTALPAPRGRWLPLLLLGALTSLLGALAVLAPVTANDPVLTWPQAGQAPGSTVVPLSPYRPLQLTAEVPCATLRAVAVRPGGGDVLRTMPASVNATQGPGLLVTVTGGTVSVTSSGRQLYGGPIGDGACGYRLDADASGTRLSQTGPTGSAIPVADRPGLDPPQVAQFETSAQGLPEAGGLRVVLHTDARYESSPTVLKAVLLIAHLLSLAALLVVAWRTWRGRDTDPVLRPRPSPADAVVLVVSAAWAVLGPVNIDDSWYALMARNGAASGSIGNYIYQFNVTENPFSTSQYLMQFWGSLGEALGLPGWGLLWLRVLPLVYGLGTYVLLRVLVCVVAGRIGRRAGVVWALAAAHLLWFLAYGITLRPEPAGTLATAAVMLLVVLARRRGSIGMLAAATAVAVIGVSTAPAALVAAVPLLLALPMLWRWLREQSWGARLAAVAVAVGAASVIVPLGFADASLGDVRESIAVHRWYYRQYSWTSEFMHYAELLEPTDQGSWGRRLPVLLTLAVLAAGLVRLGRRRGAGGPLGRALGVALVLTALSLVAVAASPTKWVNHFGAVAAPATLLLALALVRSPLPRRSPGRVLAVGAALAGVAAAVSYAGPNLWRPFTDWGQAFGTHTALGKRIDSNLLAPHLGPLYLRNPAVWAAVAAVAVYWVYRRRRAGRPSGVTPDRAVLGVALSGGVALLVVVFGLAPVSQAPGASVASMNLATVAGRPCGLADAVRVRVPAGPGAPYGDGGPGVPAAGLISGQPVFADQVSAALWPCAEQITVRDGLAMAPAWRLRTGDGMEGAIESSSTFVANGGTLAGIDRTARFLELPSALDPPGGQAMFGWGHVERVVYDHPPGLFDLSVGTVERNGWTRLPTLVGKDYTGRDFVG